jgi:hypothetical protein
VIAALRRLVLRWVDARDELDRLEHLVDAYADDVAGQSHRATVAEEALADLLELFDAVPVPSRETWADYFADPERRDLAAYLEHRAGREVRR